MHPSFTMTREAARPQNLFSPPHLRQESGRTAPCTHLYGRITAAGAACARKHKERERTMVSVFIPLSLHVHIEQAGVFEYLNFQSLPLCSLFLPHSVKDFCNSFFIYRCSFCMRRFPLPSSPVSSSSFFLSFPATIRFQKEEERREDACSISCRTTHTHGCERL